MHTDVLRSVLCISIAAAPLLCGATPGLEVWVISDSVRIDPIRNQPFEDNPKLFPDGIRPGYKQSNLIWDGTARRISMKAARNETVAFQVVIERTGEKLSNVVLQPADLKGRERMFYFGQLLKESGAPRLQYRVDGFYPRETMQRLQKILNVIILGLGAWDAATVDEIKQHGVDPWFYTDAEWIDGDGLKCRALSWIAWKLRAGSWTLWELDFNSLRAWQYPQTYERQNGSGMLVYRGETIGLDEPVPSIRLKSLRRGSQDYEYFWLLSHVRGQNQTVDQAVNAMVHGSFDDKTSLGAPGMWVHDPDEWDRMRVKFGDAINSVSH